MSSFLDLKVCLVRDVFVSVKNVSALMQFPCVLEQWGFFWQWLSSAFQPAVPRQCSAFSLDVTVRSPYRLHIQKRNAKTRMRLQNRMMMMKFMRAHNFFLVPEIFNFNLCCQNPSQWIIHILHQFIMNVCSLEISLIHLSASSSNTGTRSVSIERTAIPPKWWRTNNR